MSKIYTKLLICILLVFSFIGFSSARSKDEIIKHIAKSFAETPTMVGEFIQFDSKGDQTGGKFYIQRPGKIRFNYEKPTPIQIISNGRTVAVHNRKLKTSSFYPLKKTPLALMLSNKVDIISKAIREVKENPDLLTVTMEDDRIFGNVNISVMFDPRTFDLRQWKIQDAQSKETNVIIFNVRKNVKIPAAYFAVDPLETRRNNEADR